MRYEKTCENCGRRYVASRPDARYCCAPCRAMASRVRKARRTMGDASPYQTVRVLPMGPHEWGGDR